MDGILVKQSKRARELAGLDHVRAAFQRCAESFPIWGAPLFGVLSARIAEDPDLLTLAAKGQKHGEHFHLLAAVHYLLLRNPDDALGSFFPSIADQPNPSLDVFPTFNRFCQKRRTEIEYILTNRTVQQTWVERCNRIMPALSRVSDDAGEPLNLIEIGCSAGILLTFDKYAYDLKDRGRVGRGDAAITLSLDLHGGPLPRIPEIGKRIGIDLHPIDLTSEDARLWIAAQTFPESREQRLRVVTALNVVRQTKIQTFRGDALNELADILMLVPSPVCVYHSSCLMYWSQPAKDALRQLLLDASHVRDIYHVSAEPPEEHLSQCDATNVRVLGTASRPMAEVIISRYQKGTALQRYVAHSNAGSTSYRWVE
jgi:hypothetical protein